jgi:glucose-1-phosphatase
MKKAFPRDDLRVILFDLGGVLVQLDGVATLLELLEHRMSADDIWRLWASSPSVRAFETGKLAPAEFAAAVLGELAVELEPQRFLESFVGWPNALYPGALDLLASIPRRYQRAVLSNSNAVHWARVIDGMQLAPTLDHYFSSHLIGKMKPDVAAFEHVLKALDCKPEEVLFLDDNVRNVDAASSIGMHAFLVKGAAAARRTLLDAGVIEEASK